MGHTPGPWENLEFCTGGVHDQHIIVAGRRSVAIVNHQSIPCLRDNAEEGEVDANARLIAAAPEMLEALEDALATCENDMQYILDNGRLRDSLRSAIAKAKGESDAN